MRGSCEFNTSGRGKSLTSWLSSGISGWYGNSVFNFEESSYFFHSGCTNLHLQKHGTSAACSLSLMYTCLGILIISNCGLNSITLMTGDFEHLFMYVFLAICYVFGKTSVKSFAHFYLDYLLFHCWGARVFFFLNIYFVYKSFIRYMICKYFLPFGRLPFHFLLMVSFAI